MVRALLTLLLLFHYLLVVCVSVAERATPAARPFAYVHRADCQLRNAWRGGACFDDCNGVQYRVQKGHQPVPLQQLLTSLKGVDVHCLPLVAAATPAPRWRGGTCLRAGYEARVPGGVCGQVYLPPRRG